jgi:hypothetical protein
MRFVKGKSGNPGGRPKLDPEVKALLQEFTPVAIKTLAEIMQDENKQDSARVTAALGLLKKTLPDVTTTKHEADEPLEQITEIVWRVVDTPQETVPSCDTAAAITYTNGNG